NTHLVGRKLLAGELEDALVMFLCDSSGEKNEQAIQARKELETTRDFARALGYYPKNLRLERTIIAHLAKNPGAYANALRRLPRNILLLFVHALQSDMFNRLLSDRMSEGGPELEEGEYFCGETLGFPDLGKTEAEGWICGKLIGYGTPLNGRERALLEEYGLQKDAFRMKSLPEISSKGSYRTLLAPMRGPSISGGGAPDALVFRFSLPSGSYATMAMREFMK
ncbi:MAG: tRNA pseudouridine(13) synthase TruD, partial [Candidatus Micrarchaeota archaeon]